MHWQNTGRDFVTSSSAILQVWFGAGPFSFELYRKLQPYISFIISAGQTSNEFPRTSPMQTVSCKREATQTFKLIRNEKRHTCSGYYNEIR